MGAKEQSEGAESATAREARKAHSYADSADPAGDADSTDHGPHRPTPADEKPLLMVDIDGVISLFGFAGHAPWTGQVGPSEGSGTNDGRGLGESCYATIDGIPHLLSRAAATHLLDLAAAYDLVWASGWEEKADEHLPRLLGLPAGLPFLRFERSPGRAYPHWKLAAIEERAGSRPLAWIDDEFNDACHTWAQTRAAPTLLVQTAPERGLTSREAQLLTTWARSLEPP